MATCNQVKRTQFGLWEVTTPTSTEITSALYSRSVPVELSRLIWRPSPELAGGFPQEQAIEFDVYRDRSGMRRIVPMGGHAPYIQWAWLAGLAMLYQDRRLSWAEVTDYQQQRFVFNRVRAGREHLDRRFAASRDLYVRLTGRGAGIEASLLPEYVGRTSDGAGHRWSIGTLTQRGRTAAMDAGIANPISDVAIRYGLLLAAEMNPLYGLTTKQIKSLVFTALFDGGEAPLQVSPAILADVAARLRAAIDEHERDTCAQFDAWFSGGKSNLVKALATRSGCEPLERDTVKAALLKVGWQSYESMTHCLRAFAAAMCMGFAEPLSAAEQRQFEAMYFPQAEYGGLPLVLLLERGDLIGTVITRLWNQPDDRSLIGVLHRLLGIYAELAPARREADRRFKALRQVVSAAAADQLPKARSGMASTLSAANREQLSAVVHALARQQGDGCPHCQADAQWQVRLGHIDERQARITVLCEPHQFERQCDYSFVELARAALGVGEDGPDTD